MAVQIESAPLIQSEKTKTACFTGHRIIGGAETDQLREKLDKTIKQLIETGVSVFLAGGAIGFDALAAQAVLKARELNTNVKLILVLPCSNQESRWREADKKAYRYLIDNADKVTYVSEQPYFNGCMEKRNLSLVQQSSVCMAFMKHGRSGTSQTIRMACERGLTIINLAENKKNGGIKV